MDRTYTDRALAVITALTRINDDEEAVETAFEILNEEADTMDLTAIGVAWHFRELLKHVAILRGHDDLGDELERYASFYTRVEPDDHGHEDWRV